MGEKDQGKADVSEALRGSGGGIDPERVVKLSRTIARNRTPPSDPAVDIEDMEQEAALKLLESRARFEPDHKSLATNSTFGYERADGHVRDRVTAAQSAKEREAWFIRDHPHPVTRSLSDAIANKELAEKLLECLEPEERALMEDVMGGAKPKQMAAERGIEVWQLRRMICVATAKMRGLAGRMEDVGPAEGE